MVLLKGYGQNKMNPGTLGRQDHAHTCVIFKNKVIWQNNRQINCFQNNVTT